MVDVELLQNEGEDILALRQFMIVLLLLGLTWEMPVSLLDMMLKRLLII